MSIHNGLSIRDERCLNSELVTHVHCGPGGVLRMATEALQVDRLPAGGPCAYRDQGVLAAGQLLQMWMREIQMCGQRNYDETRNEAGAD